MKKGLFLMFVLVFVFSCKKEEPNTNQPTYTIEGRWLWSPNGDRAAANTMYEFKSGTRYTYYCDDTLCNEVYWNSLDTSDAIPERNNYTFNKDTLTIDLNFGNTFKTTVTFECEGGKVFINSTNPYPLFKLGSGCN
jgi:hypothetical protein